MADSTLKIEIDVKSKKAIKQINKIAKASGATVKEVKDDVGKMNKSMQTIASGIAGLGIGIGLTAGLKSATQFAMEFEKGMSLVNTLLDVSDSKFDSLSKEVANFAASNEAAGQDANTLTSALYNIISANSDLANDTDAAMAILKQSTQTAAAGFTDVYTASQGLTSVMNIFGKDVAELESISDSMFAVVKEGANTTFPELNSILPMVAASAQKANISFEEMMSIIPFLTKRLGGVTKTGIPLTAFLDKLPSKAENLRELGVEIFNVDGSMKSLEEIIRESQKAFTGFSDEVMAARLETAGFERRSGRAFINLIKGGDEVFRSMEKVRDIIAKGSATTDAFSKATDNAQTSLSIFTNQIKEASRQIGEKFNIVTRGLAESMQGVESETMAGNIAMTGMLATLPLIIAAFNKLKDIMPGLNTALFNYGKGQSKLLGVTKNSNLLTTELSWNLKKMHGNLGSVSKSLGAVGAVGASAFIGWQIGRTIGEVTGLDEAMQDLWRTILKINDEPVEIEANPVKGAQKLINKTEDSIESVNKKIENTKKQLKDTNDFLSDYDLSDPEWDEHTKEDQQYQKELEKRLAKLNQQRDQEIENLQKYNKELERRKQVEQKTGGDDTTSPNIPTITAPPETDEDAIKAREQYYESLAKLQENSIEHLRETSQISLEDYVNYWRQRKAIAEQELQDMPSETTEQNQAIVTQKQKILELDKKLYAARQELRQEDTTRFAEKISKENEQIKSLYNSQFEKFRETLNKKAELYGVDSEQYQEYLNKILEMDFLNAEQRKIIQNQIKENKKQNTNEITELEKKYAEITLQGLRQTSDIIAGIMTDDIDDVGQAFEDLLKNMAKQFISSAIFSLFTGGLGGGIGGLFGGLFGGRQAGGIETGKEHLIRVNERGAEGIIKNKTLRKMGSTAFTALNQGRFADSISLMLDNPNVQRELQGKTQKVINSFNIPAFELGGITLPNNEINSFASMATPSNKTINNTYDNRNFTTNNNFDNSFSSYIEPDRRSMDQFYEEVFLPAQKRYDKRKI